MKDFKLFRILVMLRGLSAMFWDIIFLKINHYFLFARNKLIRLVTKIIHSLFLKRKIIKRTLFLSRQFFSVVIIIFCWLVAVTKKAVLEIIKFFGF